MKVLADALFDFPGNIYSQGNPFLVVGDIQKGFIQRNGFDEVGIFVENLVNLCRHAFVHLHPALHENQLRAQFLGLLRRHGRTYPEFAGLIAGGSHYAPFSACPTAMGFPFSSGWSRCSTDA